VCVSKVWYDGKIDTLTALKYISHTGKNKKNLKGLIVKTGKNKKNLKGLIVKVE